MLNKIFVDLDSTINNFVDVWISQINSRYNKNFSHSDLTEYHPFPNNPEYFDIFLKDDMYQYVEPLKNCDVFLNQLYSFTDNVYILSATYDGLTESKMRHINKYFPNIPVILSKRDKHLYTDKHSVLIDDGFHNIKGHVDINDGVGILFNHENRYYYNRDLYTHDNLYRVSNYEQIIEILDFEFNI